MEKLSVAELLKGCPSGMELDCVMYEDVYFDYVDELNIIHCYIQHEIHKTSVTFNQHGAYNSVIKSKCVIFPKGKTTWDDFHRPFKNGDVVTRKAKTLLVACIYKERKNTAIFSHHIALYTGYFGTAVNGEIISSDDELCFATEEEKQKLFDAIKANGYKWNSKAKTLEKLIAPKFDLATLKPFESRVLVRDNSSEKWYPAIWGLKTDDISYPYIVVGGGQYDFCIPYTGNEHLLGTTEECDDYYKTWK